MFLLFVNKQSILANTFVEEIQENGGLKVGMPNMLSDSAMKAIEERAVIFIPLGMLPPEPPPA